MAEAFEVLDRNVQARAERIGDDGIRELVVAAMQGAPLSAEEKLEAGWLLLKAEGNEEAAKVLASAEEDFRAQAPGSEPHLLALVAHGRVCRRLGHREKAREQLESAIAFAGGGTPLAITVARANLAAVLEDEGREAEAATVIDAANEEFAQLDSPSHDAVGAALLGSRIALRLGRAADVLPMLELAVRMAEGLDLPPLRIAVRLELVAALSQASRHDKVKEEFDRAMEEVAALEPSLELLHVLNESSERLDLVGEYERAVALSRRILEIDARLRPGEDPNPALEQNLGLALKRIGRPEQATRHLQAALERTKPSPLRAAILSNLGDTYGERGEFALALAHLAEADELQRQIDPRSREAARKRNNLGLIYDRLGQGNPALLCFQQALDLHEEADRRLGRPSGDTANSMAGVAKQLASLGDLEAAQHYYERRLSIWLELAPDSAEAATGFTQLGYVHRRAGRQAEARESLEEATARFAALGTTTTGAADAFTQLGQIERESGRRGLARQHLERGLELRRAAGAEGGAVVESLCLLAELRREEGDLDGAVADFEEGVAVAEAARPHAGASEARVLSFGRAQEAYQGLIATLHQRGGRGDAKRAFAVAEASRSRGLLELIDADEGPPPEIVELEDRWAAAEEAHRAADYEKADEEESYRLALAVAEAEDALSQAQARLVTANGAAAVRDPLTLEQVQAALDERTLLLEYDATGEETFVWAVRDGQALMVPLEVGAERLGEDVRGVVGGYSGAAVSEVPEDHCRRLAETLLGPVPAEMWEGVERLFVVPDGVLHELPFDLLPWREDGELLLDRFAIASAPSATLAVLLGQRPFAAAQTAVTLALGDPAPNKDLQLDGARAEAEAVGTRFGDRAQLLLAEEATKVAFAAAAPSADIIHLATHGAVDQRQPLRSGLLFRDGLMRTYEIPRVRLGASLVVCSACESGLGQTFSGEGVLGLSRALLGAGARCVVGSLWKVHDQATRALMVSFYDHLLAGRPVTEALREAKLAVRAEYPDPFYWSAFVPVGAAI